MPCRRRRRFALLPEFNAPDATRSAIMRAVKRDDTRCELTFRSALHRSGVRYRLRRRLLGTRPDLVLVARRVAVFVEGCFWHGCPRHARPPRTNSEFWSAKIAANRRRDRRQARRLRAAGWHVVRVWEHECRGRAKGLAWSLVFQTCGCCRRPPAGRSRTATSPAAGARRSRCSRACPRRWPGGWP